MVINWAKVGVDVIVVLHFLFVIYVLLGGLFLLKWKKAAWLHVPAVIWGILVELNGWLCPLTPLENQLRIKAGLGMYDGDFVMHYIMPILYPAELTRSTQILFGTIVIIVNLSIYIYVFRIKPRKSTVA